MTARSFLINGLVAGLFAGFAAFLIAHTFGEPPVNAAIAVEEAHQHSHHESGTVVSRENQSTWGLLTSTMAIGPALGGLVALAAAGSVGRLGRLRPSQSTAVVALVGFVAVALVPFLKYPASPPSVGNPDTIGERSDLFFGYLAISVAAAIACTVLVGRLLPGFGSYRAVLIGIAAYLVLVVVAAQLMPTVNEVGSFPAQTLWTFRRASITTLATMWGTLGIVLVGLVGRAHQRDAIVLARRELAASL